MSEQDDWARFVALMEQGGWVYDADNSSTRVNGAGLHMFEHANGAGYRSDGYWYYPGSNLAKGNVGTWREWLAAGTSPVPF